MPTDDTLSTRLQQMRDEDPDGENAAALLRRLTVFDGTFESNAAAALAPSPMTDAETMTALVVLLRWGLLGRVAASEPLPIEGHVLDAIPPQAETFATLQAWGFLERETVPARYFLLKSVLRALPPPDDARIRHYEYYRRLYGNLAINAPHRYPNIDMDWSNIHAALLWGMDQSPRTAIDFVWGMQPYLIDRQPLPVQHDLFQRVLNAARLRGDLMEEGHALKALGDVAQHEMDWGEAQALYEQALSVYEKIDGRNRPLITQKMSYDIMVIDETLETAQDLYEHVLGLQTGHASNISRLVTLYTLHDLLMKQGDWATALEMMQDVFGLYEQLRNESGQCDALTVLGSTAAQSGDVDRARDYFAWAVRIGDRLLYPIGQMKALWAWGLMEQRLGQPAAGCALCQQAVMAGLSAPRVYDHDRAYALQRKLAAMGCDDE